MYPGLIYRLPGVPGIPGWMTVSELQWLYVRAREMQEVLEIGSWKGRSTHALLSGCVGQVWAVDHFQGSPNPQEATHVEAQKGTIYYEFMANVGHFPHLRVLKMTSEEAAKQFADGSIDMVFIDGEHDYESVKQDIIIWLPKTRKLICGHDYNYPPVKQAVDELLSPVNRVHGENIWWKNLNG